MVTVTEEGGLAYGRFLLEERRQQLRALEQRKPGCPGDDFSCRRSLKQAILDLETLLRQAEQAEDSEEECQCGTD